MICLLPPHLVIQLDKQSKYFHDDFFHIFKRTEILCGARSKPQTWSAHIKEEAQLIYRNVSSLGSHGALCRGYRKSPGRINYGEQVTSSGDGLAKDLPCLPTGRDWGARTEGEQGGQRRTGKARRASHGQGRAGWGARSPLVSTTVTDVATSITKS